jgi:AP-1 complex subunit beta-1
MKVQLQILTASVKLFLKKPQIGSEIVHNVLDIVMKKLSDADLRDRAYIYFRLLSVDPQTAASVVLNERPPVEDDSGNLDHTLLSSLVINIATLASVYHKPPQSFISDAKAAPVMSMKDVKAQLKEASMMNPEDTDGQTISGQHVIANLLDLDFTTPATPGGAASGPATSAGILDLLGDDFISQVQTAPPVSQSPTLPQKHLFVLPTQQWLNPQQGQGLEIEGTISRKASKIYLEMVFKNHTSGPMSEFAMQFNKNSYGLSQAEELQVGTIPAGGSKQVHLEVGPNTPIQKMEPIGLFQIAIKNNVGVFYLNTEIPLNVVSIEESSGVDAHSFNMAWNNSPPAPEKIIESVSLPLDEVKSRLEANNFHVVKSVEQVKNESKD